MRSPGFILGGHWDFKHKAASQGTVPTIGRLQYAIRVADILNNRLILQGGNFLLRVVVTVGVDTVRACTGWDIVRDIIALRPVSGSRECGFVRVPALYGWNVYGVA